MGVSTVYKRLVKFSISNVQYFGTSGAKMLLPIVSLAALSFLSSSYAAIGPKADIDIVNDYIAPDGSTRSAVLAKYSAQPATFPGPVITGYKGNRFELKVNNFLTDKSMVIDTGIHWHGIFQRKSSWADGVAGVTECPIKPFTSFLYDFSVPDQAGTFWYHSHLSTQYCDGLRGALIVYDPSDPHASLYDVDDESTIITLADWYHTPAPAAAFEPTPDSALINGLGRVPGGRSPLAVIRVSKDKKYRFRLINLACDPPFKFSIDNHMMTVIEADGVNVKTLEVDSIEIFVGQRYSFVLKADQKLGNYWVRAEPDAGPQGFEGGINSAILRYDGAPSIDPKTMKSDPVKPLSETDLHPFDGRGNITQGPADIYKTMNFEYIDSPTHPVYKINGKAFEPSTTYPILLQVLNKWPQSTYTLPPNKIIQLTIPGIEHDNPHPFHLHGHNFYVMQSAGPQGPNKNPVLRDVVSTGMKGDNVVIRFKTDNAGPWILHCHTDWHLELGLATVFVEDSEGIRNQSYTIPSAWRDQCERQRPKPVEDQEKLVHGE